MFYLFYYIIIVIIITIVISLDEYAIYELCDVINPTPIHTRNGVLLAQYFLTILLQ